MRKFFQNRSRREQFLITAFVLMGALTWAISAAGRLRVRVNDWRTVREELSLQQVWLDRQAEVEKQSAEAVRNLDSKKTLDATRLNTAITAIASQAGLQPVIEPAQTKRTPQFFYHTVKVTLRRVNLGSLLSFYDELAKQAPYLNLEQITVQTERNSAGVLNATLQVSSTQIVK